MPPSQGPRELRSLEEHRNRRTIGQLVGVVEQVIDVQDGLVRAVDQLEQRGQLPALLIGRAPATPVVRAAPARRFRPRATPANIIAFLLVFALAWTVGTASMPPGPTAPADAETSRPTRTSTAPPTTTAVGKAPARPAARRGVLTAPSTTGHQAPPSSLSAATTTTQPPLAELEVPLVSTTVTVTMPTLPELPATSTTKPCKKGCGDE